MTILMTLTLLKIYQGNSPAPTAADELDEDDNSDSDDVVLPDAKTANDVINLFSKVKEYLNKNIEKQLMTVLFR